MDEPSPLQGLLLAGVEAHFRARPPGKIGHGARMTGGERRSQVGEVGHRGQRLAKAVGAGDPVLGCLGERHLPGIALDDVGAHVVRVLTEQVDQVGVELGPAPFAGHRDRG